MESVELLRSLFDSKRIGIINLFIQNRGKQFYLRELSKEAGVPVATTHRIVQQLLALNVIKKISVSRFSLYQIESNEQAIFLASIIKERKKALQDFVDAIKGVRDVNMIILHGEETETKANLLVIGENIDTEKIKNTASTIKEMHDFTVTYMTLRPSQYDQMSSMGLLPRQKRILFER